ncbi:MAG: hypothetical protein BWZ08_02749 [candidate division BRC1 bacterium ADurb.BinA292]|nr:MAG: hypothetical protein BWZ08_02749 [candidate division BRC1 bacterium ADurb.BinA292]
MALGLDDEFLDLLLDLAGLIGLGLDLVQQALDLLAERLETLVHVDDLRGQLIARPQVLGQHDAFDELILLFVAQIGEILGTGEAIGDHRFNAVLRRPGFGDRAGGQGFALFGKPAQFGRGVVHALDPAEVGDAVAVSVAADLNEVLARDGCHADGAEAAGFEPAHRLGGALAVDETNQDGVTGRGTGGRGENRLAHLRDALGEQALSLQTAHGLIRLPFGEEVTIENTEALALRFDEQGRITQVPQHRFEALGILQLRDVFTEDDPVDRLVVLSVEVGGLGGPGRQEEAQPSQRPEPNRPAHHRHSLSRADGDARPHLLLESS